LHHLWRSSSSDPAFCKPSTYAYAVKVLPTNTFGTFLLPVTVAICSSVFIIPSTVSKSITNGSANPVRSENERRTSNARQQCGQKYLGEHHNWIGRNNIFDANQALSNHNRQVWPPLAQSDRVQSFVVVVLFLSVYPFRVSCVGMPELLSFCIVDRVGSAFSLSCLTRWSTILKLFLSAKGSIADTFSCRCIHVKNKSLPPSRKSASTKDWPRPDWR
jgi:hypothetical protein